MFFNCNNMDNYLKLCCSLIGFLFCSIGFGQAYNFNRISIQEGLSQSQAYAIFFDEENVAWIGTQGGGVCIFDGNKFSYLTKKDSLISNRVFKIIQIQDDIYIGQKGGVSVFDKKMNHLTNYRFKNSSDNVFDLIYFENKILVASESGLYRIQDRFLEPDDGLVKLEGISVFNFVYALDDDLWICSNDGFLNYKNPYNKLNKARGLSSNQVQCATLFNAEWVIGTYDNGLFFSNSTLNNSFTFDVLRNKTVLSLLNVDNQELWIGTMNNGIFVYNLIENTLKNYSTENGLSSNNVKTITSDYWGNIWIGTSGGGVSIYQNSPFIAYNKTAGLNGNYVFSILHDTKNNIWLGTDGMGVLRMNDSSRVLFDEEQGFYSEKVKSLFEDDKGNVWIGTEGKGLGLFVPDLGDTIFTFKNEKGLKGSWIKTFCQNKKTKKLFVGTADNGVFEVDYGTNFPYSVSFSTPKFQTGSLPKNISYLSSFEDRNYFTSATGEFGWFVNDELIVHFRKDKSFRNVVPSKEFLWMGTRDNGILRFSLNTAEELWINEWNEDKLASNNIYQLYYSDGYMWIGTEKGLDRFFVDSIGAFIDGKHFGYEDGFEGVETNINAGFVDKNNQLWFGTISGLFVYQGRQVTQNIPKKPTLKILDIQIVYNSIESTPYSASFENGQIGEELLLPYDKNHISFNFRAIHYSYPKKIKYRWRLEGLENDWTPISNVNIATYPNLIPGEYQFLVQASVDNSWDSQPVSFKFSIDKPYWEKFWFKFLYITIFLAIFIGVLVILFRRNKKKNEAFKNRILLEKNLLELEQKALRLQMNPHFIFNSINSIHNLIILNDTNKARYALSKFAKLMRRILENSREKFVSIESEIETLQNYVQLEILTSNSNVSIIFDYDTDFDLTEKVLPPLMLQPFVENALIHGLKGLSTDGVIKVGFKWLSDFVLECSIEDNGRGRKAAENMKSQREVYHKSTALEVAQERLMNLNSGSGLDSFEIFDLYNEDGTVKGTKVVFRINTEEC